MLEINNLHIFVNDKEIVKGIDLKIENGKVVAIMGPNGSGKTTLAYAIAGHPSYSIEGEIKFNKKLLNDMKPEERAREGVFLSFQLPPFLEGITIKQLLKKAYFAKHKLDENDIKNYKKLNEEIEKAIKILGLSKDFINREVNKNFSGGEKKKAEMLQMLLLKPSLVLIDEIDSGLDVDSLRVVANAINKMRSKDRIFIIITHYNRILSHVKPDIVVIMKDGKIIKMGNGKLAEEVEKKGYRNI